MKEVESKVRVWGRSLGVIIPKEQATLEGIKPGQTVRLLIQKKSSPIKKTFGTFKFKRSTEEMLGEADKESWDE